MRAVRAVILVSVSAYLSTADSGLGSSSGRQPRAAVVVVPAKVLGRLRAIYGKNLYLPAYLPDGYKYKSWSGRFADQLLSIEYRRGGDKMTWGIALQLDPCNFLAEGSTHVGSRTVYYGTNAGSSHDRDAWTCLRARSGRKLVVDIFDNGSKLGLRPQLDLVASVRAA